MILEKDETAARHGTIASQSQHCLIINVQLISELQAELQPQISRYSYTAGVTFSYIHVFGYVSFSAAMKFYWSLRDGLGVISTTEVIPPESKLCKMINFRVTTKTFRVSVSRVEVE